MAYIRKTYAWDRAGKMVCFHGHITRATAQRRQFARVTLSILDSSGKGRGEDRTYAGPDFAGMAPFR